MSVTHDQARNLCASVIYFLENDLVPEDTARLKKECVRFMKEMLISIEDIIDREPQTEVN